MRPDNDGNIKVSDRRRDSNDAELSTAPHKMGCQRHDRQRSGAVRTDQHATAWLQGSVENRARAEDGAGIFFAWVIIVHVGMDG